MFEFKKGSLYHLIKEDLNHLDIQYSSESAYDNFEKLCENNKRDVVSGNLPTNEVFMVLEIKTLFSFVCDVSAIQLKILLGDKKVYIHLLPEHVKNIRKIV